MGSAANPNQSEEFSFSSFASLPFYRTVNARLLDIANVGRQHKIVDLGCGTGAVTKLILDRLQSARETIIYAVDHSATALRAAISEIGERRDAVVRYVQAEVQHMTDAIRDQVDAVVYCNSIHYVPDKRTLLSQIRNRLQPGGIFAFNTSFFEGSHPPESLEFYRRWMMRSLRVLKREYGLSPVKAQKVESRQHLTPEQYSELLEDSGFKVVQSDLQTVQVPVDGWHHISGFSDWIEGVMPGVPLATGREALQKGLQDIWAEMKLESVPRLWLSVSAARA